MRTVWLDDSACCDCPLAQSQAVLLDSVGAANTLLAGFGCPEALHLVSQAPINQQPQNAHVTVVDGRQPRVSPVASSG